MSIKSKSLIFLFTLSLSLAINAQAQSSRDPKANSCILGINLCLDKVEQYQNDRCNAFGDRSDECYAARKKAEDAALCCYNEYQSCVGGDVYWFGYCEKYIS